MTGLAIGRGAVIALLKRFLIWRVSWTCYLAAFLLPALFAAAVLLNAALTQRPDPDFSGHRAGPI